MGRAAEDFTKKIVEQCLKPRKITPRPTIAGSKRQIDLLVQLEKSVLSLEVKSSIPKYGSEALRRLKEQILAFQRANPGQKLVVVGGDKVSNTRLAQVIKYLERAGVKTKGPNAGVEFVNGFVHFALWIGEVYGEECLGL